MRVMQIGEGVEHAVVAVEAALTRPRVARSGRGLVGVFGQVPLADHERGVPGRAEHLGHGRHVGAKLHRVAGIARVGVSDVADSGQVRVEAGQQRRPRRGAHGRHVEVRVPQAFGGEAVDVRRAQLRAEACEVAVAQVVDHHDDDVRRALRSLGARRPPGLTARECSTDRAVELAAFDHRRSLSFPSR